MRRKYDTLSDVIIDKMYMARIFRSFCLKGHLRGIESLRVSCGRNEVGREFREEQIDFIRVLSIEEARLNGCFDEV